MTLLNLKNYFFKEEWLLAIRKRSENLLCDNNGIFDQFSIIKNSFRYWCADPFIFKFNGINYIFFEMYDRLKRKGLIGYRTIKKNRISKMKKCLECYHHLSYPNIFLENSKIYMIPESYVAKKVQVFIAKKFPEIWVHDRTLINNIEACDSTFFEWKEKEFLLIDVNNEMQLFYQKNMDWIKADLNSIYSSINGRCAGNYFIFQNKLIRPSQDSSGGYGSGLIFNEVIAVNENRYKEQTIKYINAEDLQIKSKKKFSGIHTYNFNEDYEMIDLKIGSKFSFMYIISLFLYSIEKIRNILYPNRYYNGN